MNNIFRFITSFSGEDTEGRKGYRLGNIAATYGISVLFPHKKNLLIEYEHAEWDSAWYSHGIYGSKALMLEEASIGHWFANNTRAGLSGRSDTVRLSIKPNYLLYGFHINQVTLIDNQLPYTNPGIFIYYDTKKFGINVELNYWTPSNFNNKNSIKTEVKWHF
jgi:hypothetical protein